MESDKQQITPSVLENYKTPNHSFSTNTAIVKEIQRFKPQAKLQKLVHMRNSNILILPKDIPSLNNLLSPWPEDSFNGAQFTCRLAGKQSTITPHLKLHPNIGVGVYSLNYQRRTGQTITGKTRYQHHQNTLDHKHSHPATNNIHQDQSHQSRPICWPSPQRLLHGPFPVPSGEGLAPPHCRCFKFQQFNHISTNCANTVVRFRCGENHHHKTCTKQKKEKPDVPTVLANTAASKSCAVYLSD